MRVDGHRTTRNLRSTCVVHAKVLAKLLNKKRLARLFAQLGVVILIAPVLVSLIFNLSLIRAMRLMHIPLPRGFDDQWWLYISAFFFCVAGLLQFPFKEEEGWTCACGYDLSFINPKTKQCPECGEEVSIEWTATPGEFSRKTKQRIRYAAILFLFAAILVIVALWNDYFTGHSRGHRFS